MRCPALLRLSGDPWNVNAERLTAHKPRSCTYSAHRQRPDRDPVTRPFQYFWVPVPRGTHEYPFAQAGVGFVACHRRILIMHFTERQDTRAAHPKCPESTPTTDRCFCPTPFLPTPAPTPGKQPFVFSELSPKALKPARLPLCKANPRVGLAPGSILTAAKECLFPSPRPLLTAL